MNRTFTKPQAFYPVFARKGGADPESTHYCPGCGHGTLHKLIAEALDDFRIADRTIFVSPVGCSVFAYHYFDVGNVQAAHGRAPAVATGIKRARPEAIVIAYQGDGDLAAIGLNNIVQAANRGELLSVFFVNNALYGMTGGQMAPTTLVGQRTTTTPEGRNVDNEGYPLAMCELLATLKAPAFIERVAVGEPKQVMRARKAVRRALECQIAGKGFAFVECLAQCPTGWKMTPEASVQWLMDSLVPVFPLGNFRDEIDARPARKPVLRRATASELERLVHPPLAAPLPARAVGSCWTGEIRLKAAGFGGQGIMYLGETFAAAGMRAGDHVSWLPSYGPEMRGGTAHCHAIVSSRRIGSPIVERATHLVAMNGPSLARFEPEVADGGTVVYDSSLIETSPARSDVTVLAVPATKTADALGSVRAANMVLLGALLALSGHPTPETVQAVLADQGSKPELLALNRQALAAGAEFALAAADESTPWAV